ncbi:hypothetical protein Cantr_04103 [Candida viswanathii]|uniref:F-box domain-containing protein n=1 Tax=Candida viswanathii TaxID=5486 RepID=A0A367XRR0_9ASCO|nr:hypothetical protein Cantr_04103 [Candida viswanathii]
MGLSDLPNEIIQIIFNYIPGDCLFKLLDVPGINVYAFNSLYSVIVITGGEHTCQYRPMTKNGFPIFRNAQAYLNFRNFYPNFTPKKIIVDNPFDVMLLVSVCPQSLANVEVQLRLSQYNAIKEITSQLMEFLSVGQLQGNLHFEVDLRMFEEDISFSLAAITHILTVYDYPQVALLYEKDIPNLTSLLVMFCLVEVDLGRLPPSLEKIECSLKIQDYGVNERSVVLRFPSKLKTLNVEEISSKCRVRFDVAHLLQLNTLSLPTVTNGAIVVESAWRLPSRLKSLKCEAAEIVPRNLNTMCPELSELEILNSFGESGAITNLAKTLPSTLTRLEVPVEFFDRLHDNMGIGIGSHTQQRVMGMAGFLKIRRGQKKKIQETGTPCVQDKPQIAMLPFQTHLRKLTITTKRKTSKIYVVDFQKHAFPGLEELKIHASSNLQVLGHMPKTLTKLSLVKISRFDLKQLQSLQNLECLLIQCITESKVFDCALPDSLRELEIDLCPFIGLHIRASNLVSLKVSSCPLKKLERSNFTLPENLRKLGIYRTQITKLSGVLPDSIDTLDLAQNLCIESVSHLPPQLKHLLLRFTAVGTPSVRHPHLMSSTFPLSLETLDLSCTKASDKWIKRLNLKDCVNLKSLVLRNSRCGANLDLLFFPRSLVALDMTLCDIETITGNFANFPDLETVGLSVLPKFSFERCANSGVPYFGDNIRLVDLSKCCLRRSDFKVVYKELITKPYFELLLLTSATLPPYFDQLDLKKLKIAGHFPSPWLMSPRDDLF